MAEADLLALLRQFGSDAVSFQSLESGMRTWFGPPSAGSARACVPYVDTGAVWVAAGRPLAEPSSESGVAAAFVSEARARGRSACFFGVEGHGLEGFSSLLLGQQPVWRPREWPGTLARHRRLREQLRRARTKGVRVRRLDPHDVAEGSAMRARLEALAREWLASRHMEPMVFLVALEPFHQPTEHRYYVAECGDRVVGFLSAVPIYARRGWLIEDLLRASVAPNGTTELLFDAALRDASDGEVVTLGLAPLSGPVSFWLRLTRMLARPLYDFEGVHAFKRRLRPAAWSDVWLVFPSSERAFTHVIASLRAFSGGSLTAFALRSLARHPSGPPWALALPLVPWTLALAGLVFFGRAQLLGFRAGALAVWVAFDAMLALLLTHTARRPRPKRLATSTAAAAVDAASSLVHLARTGLGVSALTAGLRAMAAIAPCFGVGVLAWATLQSSTRMRT